MHFISFIIKCIFKTKKKIRTKLPNDILAIIFSFIGIDRGLYSALWPDNYIFNDTKYISTSCCVCGYKKSIYYIKPCYFTYLYTNICNHYLCSDNCIMQLIIQTTWLNEERIKTITNIKLINGINRELTTYWRYHILTISKFILNKHKKDIVVKLLNRYNVINYNWVLFDTTERAIIAIN